MTEPIPADSNPTESVETEKVEKTKTKLTVDQDELTLGDLETFEDIVGKSFDEAMKPTAVLDENGNKVPDPDSDKGKPLMTVKVSMKAFVAFIFLSERKKNPDITLDQVRSYKLADYDLSFSGDDEDPSPAE